MANRFSIEAVFSGRDKLTKPVERMQSRVQKFTRSMTVGFRKANRTVDKLAKGLARGAGKLAKWGGVAVAAGLTATAVALNRLADGADALAKRSRRLQFPIEEFQKWLFVGEQAGISNEEFNKSVEGMNKRLGELKAGTGSLFTFLNKTDKAFMKQLSAVSDSEQAMQMLIEKLQATKDPMKQAALANAAFGRSGLKMSNIAELGSEKIKKLMLEQQQNGVITKEQAENAEAYNDAISSLKRSLTGFMQSALLPLTPTLTEYAKSMRKWIIEHKPQIIERLRKVMKNLKPVLKDLWEKIKAFDKNHGIIEFFGKAVTSGAEFMELLITNSGTIVTAAKWILGLVVGLKALTAVLMIVNLLVAANPFVLITLAIIALIGVVVAIVRHWDALKKSFFEAGEGMDVFIGLLMMATGPIGWLVGAAALIIRHWEPIKEFFADMWNKITAVFDKIMNFEMPSFSLWGDDDEPKSPRIPEVSSSKAFTRGRREDRLRRYSGTKAISDERDAANDAPRPRPQLVTQQDRLSRTIQESRETSEVTIKDETGRAEVTKGRMGRRLNMKSTGGL